MLARENNVIIECCVRRVLAATSSVSVLIEVTVLRVGKREQCYYRMLR